MNVLDWLIEDDAPGVAHLTRRDWLGESPTARRMTSLRRKCNDYPPVAKLLDRVDDAIAAGDYKKYEGAYWTLLFLAEMHVDGRDPRVKRLAKHVLGRQMENGGFAPGGPRAAHDEIVCLTANMLRAMTVLRHFGRAEV